MDHKSKRRDAVKAGPIRHHRVGVRTGRQGDVGPASPKLLYPMKPRKFFDAEEMAVKPPQPHLFFGAYKPLAGITVADAGTLIAI